MECLNKYSKKIVEYLDKNINPILNIDDIIENINQHPLIEKISAVVKNNNVKLIDRKYTTETFNLMKIHELDELPLIFILFDHLIKNNIEIINIDKNNFNFANFIIWYRDNQYLINNKDILSKILDSKNDDLITIYSLLFNVTGQRKDLHELLYNNSFVSLDIQQHAETSNMTLLTYKINNGPNINLYTLNHEIPPNIELLFNICFIMHELSQHFSATIKAYPNITIFCGLQKKLFTTYDTILCAENVNSGSTIQGEHISIWRSEEIYKVLIHELVHFYGMDFYMSDKNYDNIEHFVNTKFCIEGFDRPNESYTETLAIIIHTMLVSYSTNVDYKKLLKYEICFSLLQVTKILKYFGFTKMEDLFDTDKCHVKINQRTSVISYFIIKTALLLNIDKFISFASTNNLIITNKVTQYLELVKNVISNDRYIDLVNKIWNITIPNGFINDTLRMSSLQI
jgi:hypothetical protein